MFIRVEIETGYHTGQVPIVIEVDHIKKAP